jgi:hypothetical protein
LAAVAGRYLVHEGFEEIAGRTDPVDQEQWAPLTFTRHPEVPSCDLHQP